MSRILIIEDEEAIADLEKDYLELSGFEVEICNRGDTGLVRALNEEFDLIILDLMLPEVDGFIQIRIKDVGDFIQVEIEDNGKGIAAKDIVYIFDRFYRTDVSRNSSKGGSGIGLSIVKKILEDHGGKVWATSRLGIGTIMYFVLRKYQEVPMK